MDTLTHSERLTKAGVPDTQAREHARIMSDGWTELKKEMNETRESISQLENQMTRSENRLLFSLGFTIIFGIVANIGVCVAIYYQNLQLVVDLMKK